MKLILSKETTCINTTALDFTRMIENQEYGLSVSDWTDLSSNWMRSFWVMRESEIRNFLVDLTEELNELEKKDVRNVYKCLLIEINGAVDLGLDDFWLDYVKSHSLNYLNGR